MGFLGKSVLVTLVAFWCFTSSSAFTEEVNHVTQTPSSAPAPSPYQHGHHHPHPPHHHHPHPHPPTKSPVKPPVSPPTKPPVKPPVSPPAKPPVKPPTKPPVKPPVSPPAKPPVNPPVSPPAKPPVIPPIYPPKFNKSLLAVQGMVYYKSCKYDSFDNTLLDAKPVEGAVVRLLCKNKKNIVVETKTDKNGYFLLLGPKTVTNFGFRGCRVYLVKSKDKKYSKVSNLHNGDVGAVLEPVKTPGKSAVEINKLVYGLFNVGPFAFDPVCPK